jgi:glycosyltransferase involved in cell wall biosynthesis
MRYIRQRDPDLLFQVTRFPVHGTATAVAGWRTDTPTITRLAGDNFNEYHFAQGIDETARIFALKNVISMVATHLPETVVALGPTGERRLRRRGRRSGIVVLPQPVDTDRFHPVGEDRQRQLREEIGMLPPPSRTLLTVGRLTHRKGIHDLISTARRLNRTDEDFHWIIIGDGSLRDDLYSVPNVHPVGHVPHPRIADYYRAADLLVHPSLHEGLPNTLLEATACGLPTVARDVGECAMIASKTYDDANQLASLVLENYDQPTLPTRFDADRLAKEYETLLLTAAEED